MMFSASDSAPASRLFAGGLLALLGSLVVTAVCALAPGLSHAAASPPIFTLVYTANTYGFYAPCPS